MIFMPWQDRVMTAKCQGYQGLSGVAGLAIGILETFTPVYKVHRPDVLVIGGNPLLGVIHALRLVESGLHVCYCPTEDDSHWDYASAAHPGFRAVIEQVLGIRINQEMAGGWDRWLYEAIGYRLSATTGHLTYFLQNARYKLSNRRSASRLLVYVQGSDHPDRIARPSFYDLKQMLANHGTPVQFRLEKSRIQNMIQPRAILITSMVEGFAAAQIATSGHVTNISYSIPGIFTTGTARVRTNNRADALRMAVDDVLHLSECAGSVRQYVA